MLQVVDFTLNGPGRPKATDPGFHATLPVFVSVAVSGVCEPTRRAPKSSDDGLIVNWWRTRSTVTA